SRVGLRRLSGQIPSAARHKSVRCRFCLLGPVKCAWHHRQVMLPMLVLGGGRPIFRRHSFVGSLWIHPVLARSKLPAPEAEAVKLCPKCGAHNPGPALTCSQCGTGLEHSDAETAVSSTVPATAATSAAATIASPSSALTVDSSFPVRPHPVQPQAQPSESSSRIPDFGPRYRVESILGEGGMGTVYKAWDKELERMVALKLVRRDLTRDPNISQRFKQELLLASKISHRNVLRIHDLGDG